MTDCTTCKYAMDNADDLFITCNRNIYKEWQREWTERHRKDERKRRVSWQ